MADRIERTYGLIGFPLTHSFSQAYFNRKFEAEGIPAHYINFELPDRRFYGGDIGVSHLVRT